MAKKKELESAKAAAEVAGDVVELYLPVPNAKERRCFVEEDGERVLVMRPDYRVRALISLVTGEIVPTKRLFQQYNAEEKKKEWVWSEQASLLAFQKLQLNGSYVDDPFLKEIHGVPMKGREGMYSNLLREVNAKQFDVLDEVVGQFRVVNKEYIEKFAVEGTVNQEEVESYLSM